MPSAELFAALSVIIVLFGAPFYLFDILKGHTKPQRTTWFIWSVQSIIVFIAQVQLHAKWSLLYIGASTLGALTVFVLSLFYGVGGWNRLDIGALIVAACGLVLSIVTKQPLIAVFGVIIADFAGVVLTIKKAYLKPSSETTITWVALALSALFAAFAVGEWNLSLLLYPIYLVLANIAVVIAQQCGRVVAARTKL